MHRSHYPSIPPVPAIFDESKSISDFSLGMKQRLGIELELLNSPKLLVLDVNWCSLFGCVFSA